MKVSVNISKISKFCVYGKDILRIRYQNHLSRQKVCNTMNEQGFAYYPNKILRYERKTKICLPAAEMIALITAIKADFNITT